MDYSKDVLELQKGSANWKTLDIIVVSHLTRSIMLCL